jgi:hypothetical protein
MRISRLEEQANSLRLRRRRNLLSIDCVSRCGIVANRVVDGAVNCHEALGGVHRDYSDEQAIAADDDWGWRRRVVGKVERDRRTLPRF